MIKIICPICKSDDVYEIGGNSISTDFRCTDCEHSWELNINSKDFEEEEEW